MPRFNVTFAEETTHFTVSYESTSEISHFPVYEGPYEITPKVRDQLFATNDKRMIDDLVVLEIPTAEVSNPSGGKTFIIGD